MKLQLNSSKQVRASLELQLCRKEEIILKTSDQLAKYLFLNCFIIFISLFFFFFRANEELWRLKNFIKRLGCNADVTQPQQQNNKEKPSQQQNINNAW